MYQVEVILKVLRLSIPKGALFYAYGLVVVSVYGKKLRVFRAFG